MRSTSPAIFLTAITLMSVATFAPAADDPGAIVAQLYGQRIEQARSTRGYEDDTALAREMLEAAVASSNNPHLLHALAERAYELAQPFPAGQDLAIEALQLIAAHCPQQRDEASHRLVTVWLRQSRTVDAERRQAIAGKVIATLTSLGDAAARRSALKDAEADYRQALSHAYRIKADEQATALRARLEAVNQQQKWHRQAKQLEARVLRDAGDSTAARSLVRLYLARLNEPERAARYVRQADDAGLTEIVTLARQPVDELDAEECLKLGDWYMDEASSVDVGESDGSAGLAGPYYRRYLALQNNDETSIRGSDADTQRVRLVMGRFSQNGSAQGGSAQGDSAKNDDASRAAILSAGGRADDGWQDVTTHSPTFAKAGWETVMANALADRVSAPTVDGKKVERYLLAHAPSVVRFKLPPQARRFQTVAYLGGKSRDGAKFIVRVDKKTVFESERLTKPGQTATIDVAIPPGADALELEVDDIDGFHDDHTFWLTPRFTP